MSEYRFFALRYVHDAVTQEFANVGIVVYSELARVLKTKLTTQFRQLSAMFGGIDGESFRSGDSATSRAGWMRPRKKSGHPCFRAGMRGLFWRGCCRKMRAHCSFIRSGAG